MPTGHQDYSPSRQVFDQPLEQENFIQGKLREGLVQRLQPKEKDLVERMKSGLKGQNVEEVLRKFSRDNKD